MTTAALTSLDVYVDGRPATTAKVLDGINTVTVPLSGRGPSRYASTGSTARP